MPRGLSLYLDVLRFAASIEVFLFHFVAITDPLRGQPVWTAFGAEAVIIFFVLSGYVISYAAVNRDRSVSHYATSRLSRVFSVSVPVLLLTVVLDCFGHRLYPAFYQVYAPFHDPFLRFGISLFL